MTKEIRQKLTNNELSSLAINATLEQFKSLSVEDQAAVVAITAKIIKVFKSKDAGRREELMKNLPEEGITGENFSVKLQNKPGKWIIDEEELAKLHPDRVIKKEVVTEQLDPLFVEAYLAKAKTVKPGQPLPPCVSYVVGEGKQMVVRTK